MIKTEPIEVWKEYQKGVQYLTNNDIYEIVKTNENFYDGRQWEGVSENSIMPKPVINVLQRVVKYLIATISSNDVAIAMTPFTVMQEEIDKIEFFTKAVDDCIENARIKEKSRLMIRNGAVDGSSYMMLSFNPDIETGQSVKGDIEATLIDNTNMYFGNPYSNDIQNQPYIIVALRQNISQVKAEAEDLGVDKDEIDAIRADNDTNQVNDDSEDLVTVLLKFYKQKVKVKNIRTETDLEGNPVEIVEEKEIKTVYFTKCTKDVTLIKPVDLGYKRYPISCFGWDAKKNSYLWNSPLTANIANQIFINKAYALAQMYGLQNVYPKIVYDKNKIDISEFMDNTAFAVTGIDMMGKIMDFIKVPDFSNNIIGLIENIMQQTKECMGVNDASLGNVDPDNTSAIIALQEASNVPLELQRQTYFEMWEDTVRNILDIMAVAYGIRLVMREDNVLSQVDFSVLNSINYHLRVEIGNGSQFSESAQMSTLTNLFTNQIIDGQTLVESTPQKLLTNKQKILQKIREQQEAQAQMQQQMMMQNQVPPQR